MVSCRPSPILFRFVSSAKRNGFTAGGATGGGAGLSSFGVGRVAEYTAAPAPAAAKAAYRYGNATATAPMKSS